MSNLKKFLKDIILLLLILGVIGGIFYGKYTLDSRKKERLKPYKEQLSSQTSEEINSQKSTLCERMKSFGKNKLNIDNNESIIQNSKNIENGNTLIEFNVSSDYESFVFDDRLLMYKGEQTGINVKEVLDIMLADVTDDFYSEPVLTVHINGNNASFENDENYINNIKSVRDKIKDDSKYQISFGFNKTKTIANEVIISE